MSEYNIRKRAEAVAYLKMRGKHLLSTTFTPTNAANTNVAKTFEEFKNDSNRVRTNPNA
jgi:hypothetical protein